MSHRWALAGLLLLAACAQEDATVGQELASAGGPGDAARQLSTGGVATASGGVATGGLAMAGGGQSSSTGGATSCASADVSVTRARPTVWLAVPGGNHMQVEYGGETGDPQTPPELQRWGVLRDALLGPTGVVAAWQHLVRFGAVIVGPHLLAGVVGDACPPLRIVTPAIDNLDTLAQSLPDAAPFADGSVQNSGAGELYGAVGHINTRLLGAEAVASDVQLGTEAIITGFYPGDGVCEADRGRYPGIDGQGGEVALVQEVRDAVDRGAKVFALRMDDPIADSVSERVAALGQSGYPALDARAPQALRDALGTIVEALVGCDVTLNGEVSAGQECQGQVLLDGTPLDCNAPDGWRMRDARTIELTGAACEQFRTQPNARLEADFPCAIFYPI